MVSSDVLWSDSATSLEALEMLEHTDQELESLIRSWDRSAEHHVELAKRAHTEFQRLFHAEPVRLCSVPIGIARSYHSAAIMTR